MNLPETGQGLTIDRPPVEVSGTIVQFMPQGYAIEKNPTPVDTIFIPESPDDAALLASMQPETDTAVTGEDRDAVVALIAEGRVIRPVFDLTELESASEDSGKEESPTIPEKRGAGKNMLQAMRRSRLGMFVATTATTAVALLAANTESAKGAAEPALIDNVPSLGGNAALLGTTEASASDATTSEAGAPEYDPEALKQYCIDIALAKPQIIKSQLLNVGNFDRTPYQSYFLSGRYQPWPEECGGFARGNQARGQAFYKGRWVNMNYWRGVGILRDTNIGNWVGDIANLDNLRFPVCRARIQLKANIVDLSVSMNEETPWKPQHPTIAKKQFAAIPAKILPRKPKDCR